MFYFQKIFAKNPYTQLRKHLVKVECTVNKLDELLQLFYTGDIPALLPMIEEVSRLEHECDLVKNDLRKSLAKRTFFSANREQLYTVLRLQDDIADSCEKVAMLFQLQKLEPRPEILEAFQKFAMKNIEAFGWTMKIMNEIETICESTFGGYEALKVKGLIDELSYLEHEADVLKREFMKKFFEIADGMSAPTFYLWMRLIDELGLISHSSEKQAMALRYILDLKT